MLPALDVRARHDRTVVAAAILDVLARLLLQNTAAFSSILQAASSQQAGQTPDSLLAAFLALWLDRCPSLLRTCQCAETDPADMLNKLTAMKALPCSSEHGDCHGALIIRAISKPGDTSSDSLIPAERWLMCTQEA